MNIALAGLGTVGAGVLRLLQRNKALISARTGQPITVVAVSARDKNKKRDCDLSGIAWVEDPLQLVARPDVHTIVELIGGADGPAHALAEATLKAGKNLVTANKALLAKHGIAIARLSEARKTQVFFEAAVAGGVPVIKTLREGLAANTISSVRGILNGTCNFILTRMLEAGMEFKAALIEAQKLGYAEADPAADIEGHDTANKLAILSSLAFGVEPDLKAIPTQGINHITPLDLQFAGELDCRIKLLGVAKATSAGLVQYVAPCLVPKKSPLSKIAGATNAILLNGNFCGDVVLEGAGAGAEPTASAVVADLIDLSRGHTMPLFGIPVAKLTKVTPSMSGQKMRFYMRLQVMDKPGVVADISAILRDADISIETLLQRAKSATQSAPVVITTHDSHVDAMQNSLDKIAKLSTIVDKPCLLPIEE